MNFELAWLYGRYDAYWQYNFISDERKNIKEAYEQAVAMALGWA